MIEVYRIRASSSPRKLAIQFVESHPELRLLLPPRNPTHQPARGGDGMFAQRFGDGSHPQAPALGPERSQHLARARWLGSSHVRGARRSPPGEPGSHVSGTFLTGTKHLIRRIRLPLLADGFDTGDTSAWSQTVPRDRCHQSEHVGRRFVWTKCAWRLMFRNRNPSLDTCDKGGSMPHQPGSVPELSPALAVGSWAPSSAAVEHPTAGRV